MVLSVLMFYLILVLNERPQLALALASRFLFPIPGVGQAGFGHRPFHGLAIVFKLNISRRLEPRLIGLHYLLRVLIIGELWQQLVMGQSIILHIVIKISRAINFNAMTQKSNQCLFTLSE